MGSLECALMMGESLSVRRTERRSHRQVWSRLPEVSIAASRKVSKRRSKSLEAEIAIDIRPRSQKYGNRDHLRERLLFSLVDSRGVNNRVNSN